jgi:hypothetical protein
MKTYVVERQLDEKWYKSVMDFINVDVYEDEICLVNKVEVL